jgi:DNA polymerase-3 subunit epsilon
MTEPQIEPPPDIAWDEPIATAPLVFLDLEMTGLVPEKDRVIELCAERVRGEHLEARLCSLVQPPAGAFGNAQVHGIRPADLASAPSFPQIAPHVEELIRGGIVVAHAASWDVRFLEAEFARAGRPIRIPYYLDTLTLSRRAFALPSHSLAALCTELGIQRDRPHRADDDVHALRQVFRHILRALASWSPPIRAGA